MISYANSKVVLPGDNDEESWTELLRQNGFKRAIADTDILVAPHHGLESGYCQGLFEHIHPKLVIIPNGRFTDTSCIERYGKVATGWNVQRRNREILERKCVTTRNDGNIEIAMGWTIEGKNSYLSVITG